MNNNLVVLGKRRKIDEILMYVMTGILVAILLAILFSLDLKNIDEEQIAAIAIISFLILFLVLFTLLVVRKSPKDLIVLDKENNTLLLRAGQSLPSQRKQICINLNDVIDVEYVKPKYGYYVVVSTYRAAYLKFTLINGATLGVVSVEKPKQVELQLKKVIKEATLHQNNL